MIEIYQGGEIRHEVRFLFSEETGLLPEPIRKRFAAGFLSCFPYLKQDRFILFVGLGRKEEFSAQRGMEAAARGARQMDALDTGYYAMDILPLWESFGEQAAVRAALGIRLGLYRFDALKKDPAPHAQQVLVKVPGGTEERARDLLHKALCVADSVLLARDWVNMPANLFTPQIMADTIARAAEDAGAEVEILDEAQIKALGMGAFLAVGGSAAHPPRLIVLRYRGDAGSDEITALVGKGVACDTGGYNIKTGMSAGIKGDMAGGAAAAAALIALCKNKVRANVVCVIPACENRISPGSLLPGDVVQSMSGKSIEILNTDAEGRLILADAVTYAIQKEKAARIVDIATLTGAVGQALGGITAGALSNDRAFWGEFERAYESSGERYWRFPDYPEYRKMLDSDIADIKNMGEKQAGTITAALFIRAFVENLPWIHLDIAGTAWSDKPLWEFQQKGATGAGVTSLYCLFDKLQ